MSSLGNNNAVSVQKPVQAFLSDLRSSNNRLIATNNELESAIYRLTGNVPPTEPQPGQDKTSPDKPSAIHEARELATVYEINLRRYGMLVEALVNFV